MAKAEWIAHQSAHPRGWIGHIVARVMARDTARENTWALEALAPQPGEAILELGCGHGRSLARLAASEPTLRLWGVDPSAVMRRESERRNRAAVAAGRVRIEPGEAGRLPFEDERFDAAFSVHTVYFWPDVCEGMREVARVLRPGGRLLLVYRPDTPALQRELPASVYRLREVAELEEALDTAGFDRIATHERTDAKSAIAFTHAQSGRR